MPYGHTTISQGSSVILPYGLRKSEFEKELYNSKLHQFNSIKNEENENKKRDKRASEISNELIAEGKARQNKIAEAQLDKILDNKRDLFNERIKRGREERQKQLLKREQLSTQGAQGGFRHKKPSVPQSKEILGKIRRVYKVAGSRKEHVKYKGELIPVSDYKKLFKK